MNKLRYWLSTILLCSIFLIRCALSQSSLTQIRDIVHNADGSPFNGTVTITWNGFTAPDGSTIAPHSTSAQIYNGALSILLVPSTTASAGANYVATYNSNDGLTTWSETWQVPPSATPLLLSQVRQATSSGTGSSGSGSTGGGSTGSGSGSTITLPLPITQVSGLSAALANINSNINTLSQTVQNLPQSGTSAVFVDAEVPSGSINGTNAAFTLAHTPSPATSLQLYLNGLEQTAGVDFTLSNSAVTFAADAIPRTGDELEAFYRIPGTGPAALFTDGETPGGTINGTNLAFTLAAAPAPAMSLRLYKNGMLQQQGRDYTLSGAAITFSSAATAPQAGDTLTASYRH